MHVNVFIKVSVTSVLKILLYVNVLLNILFKDILFPVFTMRSILRKQERHDISNNT
jgi:hypothetical protein